jgi:hypothetical protein
MPKPVCTVCAHPSRPEIDAALVGRMPVGEVADTFGVSRHALGRHRDHVVELQVLPKEPTRGTDAASTIAQILDLEDELRLLLAKAKRANNRKEQLTIIDKLMVMIEFRAKLAGVIKPQKGAGNKPAVSEGFHGDLDGLIERARRSKPS